MSPGGLHPRFLVPLLLATVLAASASTRARTADGRFGSGETPGETESGTALIVEAEARLGAILEPLVEAGDWRGALARADEALATSPLSIVAWQHRAYALHQLGRLADARAAYEKTTALDPDNHWAHLNLADVLLREERWEDARDAALLAIALQPSYLDARKRLSLAHRGQAAYEDAILVIRQALVDGVDPAWCHAELAYLTWAVESPAESEEHWTLATELGFDPKACAHGQRIAAWESELLSLRTGKVSSGRPTTHPDSNGEWVFPVGRIEVHTGIGPALPGEVEETLLDLQKEFASFLGIKGPWTETVRLHLHRTIEEHEKARLRQFPEGYRGKGFLVQEPQRRGRPGRFGPRDGDRKGDAETLWRLDMHVAFSEPDLERSLSHELAHAMLHVRTPRAMNTAVWFDEGLATYLELSPDEQGHLASETLRADLLEAARAAQREKTLLPWREMLRAQRPTFAGSMAYTRYAQAWAMIFFLVHETSSGRVRLRKYIGGLESEGRDWIGGFSTVWDPDLEAIDRRFRRWLETAGSK